MINADSAALRERKAVLWITRAISYLVYAYLVVVEIILLMGFILLLFGANPSAGFTEWVYRNLDRVMSPFRGIFTPIELGTNGGDVPAVFETSVVFAMIVYGIVALLLSALIGWLSGRLNQVVDAETEIQRRDEYQARLDAVAAQAPGQPGVPGTTAPPAGAVPPPILRPLRPCRAPGSSRAHRASLPSRRSSVVSRRDGDEYRNDSVGLGLVLRVRREHRN